jgi:hypothetical protein
LGTIAYGFKAVYITVFVYISVFLSQSHTCNRRSPRGAPPPDSRQ